MEVDEIYVHDELPYQVTREIGSLFHKACIILAHINYTRTGFDAICKLRTQLQSYYGLVHPQEVYHRRINTMYRTVFSDIHETFLKEDEKEHVFMYMGEINRLMDNEM